jgi:hypothetical protein
MRVFDINNEVLISLSFKYRIQKFYTVGYAVVNVYATRAQNISVYNQLHAHMIYWLDHRIGEAVV